MRADAAVLPCPFCGSVAPDIVSANKRCYSVECRDCEARGPAAETITEALAAWDTRTFSRAGIVSSDESASIKGTERG